MATTFEFTISCDASRASQAGRALEECHRIARCLERELSEFLPESPVHRLNRASPFERIRVPESVLFLLRKSRALASLTAGSFDALAKSERSPAAAANHDRIGWSDSDQVAWRADTGARLSFGAIGKGYALDRARSHLERLGFSDFLLSAGGSSIVLSGFAGPGDPWQWGWSWSKDPDGSALGVPFSHDSGSPVAIGVSGTHEQGAHLLDPRSGQALSPGDCSRSALVTHDSATDADALSTALFVAGWEGGIENMSRCEARGAATIDRDGVPRWTSSFSRLWQVPSKWLAVLLAGFSLFLAHASLLASSALAAGPGAAPSDSGGAIDLGALGGNQETFMPYLQERNRAWALLPILSVGLVLLHLKKYKAPARKKNQSLVQITKI